MKMIGITMAVCLAAPGLAFANGPMQRMDSDTYSNQDSGILPDTYVKDGDGSGLGISETSPGEVDTATAPGDVDSANMGETGASGAVGTATGTTDSTGKPPKAKGKKGAKVTTSTSTSTATATETHTH